jgi:hypothetical protein
MHTVNRLFIIATCLLLSSTLALADGVFDGYWYFGKSLSHEQVSEFLQDTTFPGTEAQLHLLQNGLAVTGTWRETTQAGVRSGALKGVVQGDTLQIYFCSDGSSGKETSVCPNYPAEFDYLVNHGTYVAWYRHNQNGFEKYMALLHRTSDTLAAKSGQATDSKSDQP